MQGVDAVFDVDEGLPAPSLRSHAVGVLALAHEALDEGGWCPAPLIPADQARVAAGHGIGELLHPGQVAIVSGDGRTGRLPTTWAST